MLNSLNMEKKNVGSPLTTPEGSTSNPCPAPGRQATLPSWWALRVGHSYVCTRTSDAAPVTNC